MISTTEEDSSISKRELLVLYLPVGVRYESFFDEVADSPSLPLPALREYPKEIHKYLNSERKKENDLNFAKKGEKFRIESYFPQAVSA